MDSALSDYLIEAEQRCGLKPRSREARERLHRLLAASDFLGEEFQRQPALAAYAAVSATSRRRAVAPPRPDPASAELAGELRRWRRFGSASIVIDDVLGRADLPRSLAQCTELAEAAIEIAFAAAARDLAQRHGRARDSEGRAQDIVVLGMGKLGSGELNFSSDIDLIAAFDRAGETDGGRCLDNEEYFARMVQRATPLLAETSAEGFVYRVDWRLRPFGSAGRLCLSHDAMEDYYQREGRDWERFALLRARPVAGDQDSGTRLLARLKPFVWRRYLDYAALEGLRETKALIDSEVRRREREQDLKLGPGGIREIEFRVQLESVIRGGRDPGLRVSHTLELIERLRERAILAAAEADALAQAWHFLRRLENRVQMLRDEQTHRLPEDALTRARLAFALGHADWAALHAELDRHRAAVAESFERCLPLMAQEGPPRGAGHALWRGLAPGPQADEGAETAASVAPALRSFAESPSVLAMSARGRARLDRIMPLVLDAQQGADPVVLERWLSLLGAILGRTSYLALLAERPALIARVQQLLAASAWLGRALAESPILLDDLLDERRRSAAPDRMTDAAALAAELAAVEQGDSEAELERVRQYQQSARLDLALAFLDGRMDGVRTAAALADLAAAVIRALLDLALRDVSQSCGYLPGYPGTRGLALIAYGSLGGRELNFASDLDLVFVYDEAMQGLESSGPRVLDGQRWVARVIQRLLHLLTVQTAFGPLYEIDARLRPNGNKGLLVTPFSAYAEYQRQEAWLWEHQALVRARFLAGDAELGAAFAALRHEILGRERAPATLHQDIAAMRRRWREALDRSDAAHFDLKQGAGGLVDLEFMAQEAVLGAGAALGSAACPTETTRLLPWLAERGLLSPVQAQVAAHAHARLLSRGLACTLALERRLVPLAERESLLGP